MRTKLLTMFTILAGLAAATPPVLGAPWTPIAITNTALWLDAADTETVLTSGSSVTNWLDKSGNDHHVLQSNGSRQPSTGRDLNGLNSIDFNVAWNALQTATNDLATWLNGTNYHIIAVLEQDGLPDPEGYFIGTDSPQGTDKVLHVGQQGTSWKIAHFGDDTGYSHALDTNAMLSVSSFNNTGSEFFKNGTSVGASSQPSNPLNTAGPLSIGRPVGIYAAGNLGYYDGAIGEIVIIVGDMSTDTRQELEGYLAHKWEIADKLPGGHPYKEKPPTIPDAGTVLVIR